MRCCLSFSAELPILNLQKPGKVHEVLTGSELQERHLSRKNGCGVFCPSNTKEAASTSVVGMSLLSLSHPCWRKRSGFPGATVLHTHRGRLSATGFIPHKKGGIQGEIQK